MSEDLYKIILTGYYHVDISGYKTKKGEYFIEKDFADLFHITREQAKELFQHLPKVLKENITIEEANLYRNRIEKAGASCEIQDMDPKSAELSLAPD